MVLVWFRIAVPSLEAVIIIVAISLFLSRILQVPYAFRFVPELKGQLWNFDRQQIKLIAAFRSRNDL